jgi:hypothetical protein
MIMHASLVSRHTVKITHRTLIVIATSREMNTLLAGLMVTSHLTAHVGGLLSNAMS